MKFAYLIMAHNNPEQLNILLKMLDYKENDIFLHIDRKCSCISINTVQSCIKHASLHVYRKYKVYHADYSQTICQTYLLEEACKTYHDYYHLISNADLPLKSNSAIINFFEENRGKEFVHFESNSYTKKENCKYYFFLNYFICRMPNPMRCLFLLMEKISINIQKKCGVDRKFYCGANWYSISHSLAKDFCEHKKEALHRIRWTISSDELIMQTFIRDISPKKYSLYSESTSGYDYNSLNRKIDWHRGSPYVWREQDYHELISSTALFGRKFDINVDTKIIQEIVKHVGESGK